jgi:hypothetical protein
MSAKKRAVPGDWVKRWTTTAFRRIGSPLMSSTFRSVIDRVSSPGDLVGQSGHHVLRARMA